jgi:predicted Zn-dependent protease
VYYAPDSEAVVDAALLRWKETTGGFFTWERVASASDAQITFKPVPASEFVPGMIGLTNYTFNILHNELLSSEVRYAVVGTKADQVRVVSHEIGHAIGIHGHSDTNPDMMCPRVSRRNVITERDVNTLFWLYRPAVLAKLNRTKRGRGPKKTQTITCGLTHR